MNYTSGCFGKDLLVKAVCLGEYVLDEVYCCCFQKFKIDSLWRSCWHGKRRSSGRQSLTRKYIVVPSYDFIQEMVCLNCLSSELVNLCY